ncbi:electron transfer flavoprotein subunit alpha, mitochondrial-like [Centropristis striata]|uniref:electron transfer flavoprotein subunit alpha, mitochondrial-like n=1 Tax=Centropristis striata TaxID=184440 RepID=UPI0027DF8382|nr:electron transfer flavoprotein subunit alpha, mitochondrial-like [Centropristis striata]
MNLLPRVSAKLHVATLSDITKVKSQDAFIRAVCAAEPLVVINAVGVLKELKFLLLIQSISELLCQYSCQLASTAGRGLKSCAELAAKLNAAVRASRARGASGRVPGELRVSQTGKTAPPLSY